MLQFPPYAIPGGSTVGYDLPQGETRSAERIQPAFTSLSWFRAGIAKPMDLEANSTAESALPAKSSRVATHLRLKTRPWEIAATYLAFGLLWIFFSDRILAAVVSDPDRLVVWSSFKGFAFVLITAVVLLVLLIRSFAVIGEAYASLATAEQALRNEKLFADTMIESMPGTLYFYDATGRFMRWNKHLETLSGYSGEEIASLHPQALIAAEDRDRVNERIAEVFTSGTSSIEASLLSKDGRTTPHYFTGRRVEFDNRPCLVGVGIDISSRREAERSLAESERKYRLLVENANSIILRWNAEGRITFLNAYGLRFFGYATEEILGQHVMGTLVPVTESSGRDLHRLMEQICSAPEAFEQNINENIRRSGERVWVAWTNKVEYDPQGNVREILSIGADITDRLRVEAEQEKRHRAETADRIKSAFLATMSHELRTPLNSIIGFTGIILQELAGPLNAEQTKQLGMVQSSARHLLALVNDVLDISKIEAGQLKVGCADFDIRASLSKVIATVKPLAEAKQIALSAQVSPQVAHAVNDERRFEQVLLNLLSNAVKFTDRGAVTLEAKLIDDYCPLPDVVGQPAVRVSVTDTGMGIREEDLPTLFQPFRQIDSGLARRHEGTGLGLAICRRLAALMGGDVEVESRWGHGSTFSFVMPLQGSAQP